MFFRVGVLYLFLDLPLMEERVTNTVNQQLNHFRHVRFHYITGVSHLLPRCIGHDISAYGFDLTNEAKVTSIGGGLECHPFQQVRHSAGRGSLVY